MTEPLVRALPAASLENQANVLDELAWAARTLYRYGITSDERDAELRAYTGAPFAAHPATAPWLAVITAAQAWVVADDALRAHVAGHGRVGTGVLGARRGLAGGRLRDALAALEPRSAETLPRELVRDHEGRLQRSLVPPPATEEEFG